MSELHLQCSESDSSLDKVLDILVRVGPPPSNPLRYSFNAIVTDLPPPHRFKTDLKVVKSRIEAGAFRSIHEFQHALCTMFLNVQMMHPVGTEVSE